MRDLVIQIDSVTKTFEGGITALDDISLSVQHGEFITIIGPSGCGKTTLLRILNGMTVCDSGEIKIMGKDLESWDKSLLRRDIGYVIQNSGLFPHMTVKENIQFVMSISGIDREAREKRTRELAEMIGFEKEQLDEYPDTLSGGQQQRIGIARALAMRPEIVLMDEPLGALDNITRKKLQTELKEIHINSGTTMVMVTHDLSEAFSLGTETIIMNKGRILQKDKPENILRHPADEWITEFVSGIYQIWPVWS